MGQSHTRLPSPARFLCRLHSTMPQRGLPVVNNSFWMASAVRPAQKAQKAQMDVAVAMAVGDQAGATAAAQVHQVQSQHAQAQHAQAQHAGGEASASSGYKTCDSPSASLSSWLSGTGSVGVSIGEASGYTCILSSDSITGFVGEIGLPSSSRPCSSNVRITIPLTRLQVKVD